MFFNAGLSTLNYDKLLIDWEAQSLQPNLFFNGGNSSYCLGSAAHGRLQSNDGWTITDAGEICPASCDLGLVSGSNSGTTAFEACDELRVDSTFNAQSTADITLAAGTGITFQPGFTVEEGGILDAKVCGQSLCEASTEPMEDGCHSCVTAICAPGVDPLCCNTKFDSVCVQQVDSVCGLVCDAP